MEGQRKVGYVGDTLWEIVEANPLPVNTSAQLAELIALPGPLLLAKYHIVNIYTNSKYAFGVLHAHRALWRERG